jgi:hypothetical protein
LLARTFVVWTPVLVVVSVVLGLGGYFVEADAGWVRSIVAASLVALITVLTGAIIFAGIRPTAGLQDLITRTRLVPV